MDVFTYLFKQHEKRYATCFSHLKTMLFASILVNPTFLAKIGLLGSSADQMMVGTGRVELPTSRLSVVRSNHLSYAPETLMYT